ncbi:plantaricin C family lantibiotic [Bacillus swezeyi]|uniref:plantaricin C family lantibiotic n=1 Tax=Bacillus swezeyi TaxID=1925020 RepID=UPI003F88D6C8
MEERLYHFAGNVEEELEEISLKNVSGGAEQRGISQGNDGKYCTLTWECGLCPTHTCFC